jgi:hypothetical protein
VTPLLRCHALFGAPRPARCDWAMRSAAALGQRSRRVGAERRDAVTPRERCHKTTSREPRAKTQRRQEKKENEDLASFPLRLCAFARALLRIIPPRQEGRRARREPQSHGEERLGTRPGTRAKGRQRERSGAWTLPPGHGALGIRALSSPCLLVSASPRESSSLLVTPRERCHKTSGSALPGGRRCDPA